MGTLREAARDRDWQGGLGLAHCRLGSVEFVVMIYRNQPPLSPNLSPLARARRAATGGNKATATNHPCQALSPKSPIPKERLRVSNWIVPGLYDYAVSKTVEL